MLFCIIIIIIIIVSTVNMRIWKFMFDFILDKIKVLKISNESQNLIRKTENNQLIYRQH